MGDAGGLAQLEEDKGRVLSRDTSVGLEEQAGVSAP